MWNIDGRYCFLYHIAVIVYAYYIFQGDGAIQKGLPFKYYHGKTGRIFNVTQHAVGVTVNKRVG